MMFELDGGKRQTYAELTLRQLYGKTQVEDIGYYVNCHYEPWRACSAVPDI